MASVPYEHILACIPGSGVDLNISQPFYGSCSCTGDSCGQTLTCTCMNRGCAYDTNEFIKTKYFGNTAPPIIECSSYCMCTNDCLNRTTQKPCCTVLEIRQTKEKGFGVFTTSNLPCGMYICEYVGEIIRTSAAEERLRNSDTCYIIKYREHTSNGTILTTCIDASHYGNIARFINHSCKPNITILPVRSSSIVPRLCCFTNEHVLKDNELCFSYFGTSETDVPLGMKPCLCKSQNCVGFLPLQN